MSDDSLMLMADVDRVKSSAAQAFAETTRTVQGEAMAGHAPSEKEIMDIWIRSFMFNGWGLVQDPNSESGWRPTEDSAEVETN